MASPNIERIIEQVRGLSPAQQQQVRAALERADARENAQIEVMTSTRPLNLEHELQWVEEHRAEYAGQWVAVRGNQLLGSGTDGKEVYRAARAAGDERPFVTRVAATDELPFAGW